jgi:hypothetical protein
MKSAQKAPITTRPTEPGQELYNQVRAGFVLRNTTFNRWCVQNQVTRQNAVQALLGGWNGPKARKLRDRLLSAAGLNEESING